jgi:hypothetical protein
VAKSEFEFRGEVVDFEVVIKYEMSHEIDYDYITLIYEDGRRVTFRGGDHGNDNPWVYLEVQ